MCLCSYSGDVQWHVLRRHFPSSPYRPPDPSVWRVRHRGVLHVRFRQLPAHVLLQVSVIVNQPGLFYSYRTFFFFFYPFIAIHLVGSDDSSQASHTQSCSVHLDDVAADIYASAPTRQLVYTLGVERIRIIKKNSLSKPVIINQFFLHLDFF